MVCEHMHAAASQTLLAKNSQFVRYTTITNTQQRAIHGLAQPSRSPIVASNADSEARSEKCIVDDHVHFC